VGFGVGGGSRSRAVDQGWGGGAGYLAWLGSDMWVVGSFRGVFSGGCGSGVSESMGFGSRFGVGMELLDGARYWVSSGGVGKVSQVGDGCGCSAGDSGMSGSIGFGVGLGGGMGLVGGAGVLADSGDAGRDFEVGGGLGLGVSGCGEGAGEGVGVGVRFGGGLGLVGGVGS